MKKIFALLMTAVLVMALAVPAFAQESPSGEEIIKIHVVDGNGAKPEISAIKVGEYIELTADPDKGEFDGWVIYLADGETEAVLSEHYTLGEGEELADESIKLYPLTDLIVTANYNGEDTKVEVDDNGDVNSPQTGDATVLVLSAVMLLTLSGMVVLKKRAA